MVLCSVVWYCVVWCGVGIWLEIALNKRTKLTVVEGVKSHCYQRMKIKLKRQQPWTAVQSSLLGLVSMAQLADELWVPT